MDVFHKDHLRALLKQHESPCISIYLPTHRAMPDTLQDPIRFRNHLNEAERRLNTNGNRSDRMAANLGKAQALLEDFDFWQHPSDGLAVFIGPDVLERYRVPLPLEEVLVIGSHFHVKPLLPLLSGDGHFFILALSQNSVRLLRATKLDALDVALENVPHSLDEALEQSHRAEKQTQYHTRAGGTSGERNAMYHGHGAGDEDMKENILKYFRQVERGLRELLHNETAPLALAGVEYLHPIYREANTYKHLLDEGVKGNPEGWSDEELHTQAWKVAQPYVEKARTEALDRFEAACGKELGVSNLEQIIPAANEGRVDTLFVASGVPEWGTFDPDSGTVVMDKEARTGNEDLLNLAAVHTIRNGGTVFTLKREDMPSGHLAAAILRY